MSYRTTEAAVAAIVEVDADLDLVPFIEVANSLVTELCVPAGYGEARLELIERWLAAHFYAIRDTRVSNETARGIGASYQYKLGLNLLVTMYGQQAATLDTAGGLGRASKQAELGQKVMTAGVSYLGTVPTTEPETDS